PSGFVFMDALPTTANGKLDRRALPAPEPADDRPWVAPRGPVEEAIAGVWREVLGVDRVGAHDDFFQLGGHSLRATQVVSRVRDAFGVGLPLRRLYEAPTPSGLARAVEALRGGGRAAAPPIRRRASAGPVPLSFAQQRLWFLDQYAPGSAAWNVGTALRLVGELNGAALVAAMERIVERHEILRTTFPVVDGVPAQQIHDEVRMPVVHADVSALASDARERALQRILGEEASQP